MYFFVQGGDFQKITLMGGGACEKNRKLGGGGHTIFKLHPSKSHQPPYPIKNERSLRIIRTFVKIEKESWSYMKPNDKYNWNFLTSSQTLMNVLAIQDLSEVYGGGLLPVPLQQLHTMVSWFGKLPSVVCLYPPIEFWLKFFVNLKRPYHAYFTRFHNFLYSCK